MRGVECPRCGAPGSLQRKWVRNKVGRRYGPYHYVAHYDPGRRGVRWCYVPRAAAVDLLKSLPNPILRPRSRGPGRCSDPLRLGCRGPPAVDIQVRGRPRPVCGRCWDLILEGGYEW